MAVGEPFNIGSGVQVALPPASLAGPPKHG
jgi:hypothetical protein